MSLPIFLSKLKELTLMQTNWANQLNPIISSPITSGIILKSISLKNGSNIVNHMLSRALQGWFIVRQRASASIYDTQDTNQFPSQTLLLTSSANVMVDLFVF